MKPNTNGLSNKIALPVMNAGQRYTKIKWYISDLLIWELYFPTACPNGQTDSFFKNGKRSEYSFENIPDGEVLSFFCSDSDYNERNISHEQ